MLDHWISLATAASRTEGETPKAIVAGVMGGGGVSSTGKGMAPKGGAVGRTNGAKVGIGKARTWSGQGLKSHCRSMGTKTSWLYNQGKYNHIAMRGYGLRCTKSFGRYGQPKSTSKPVYKSMDDCAAPTWCHSSYQSQSRLNHLGRVKLHEIARHFGQPSQSALWAIPARMECC